MNAPDKPFPLFLIGGVFGLGIALGGGLGFTVASSHFASNPERATIRYPSDKSVRSDTKGSGSATGETESGGKSGLSAQTRDFSTRLHEAMNQRNQRKRWKAITDLIESMDPSRIPEALAAAQLLHGNEKQMIISQLLSHWAEKDPQGALAYAQGLTKIGERNQAVAAVLGGWVQNDPAAAMAWVQQLPAGAMKTAALQQVILQLVQTDPKSAVQLAASGGNRNQFLSMALANWANQNLDGALNYLAQMPEGAQKNRVLQSMIYSVSNQDPTRAIALIDQMTPSQMQDQVLQQVAGIWMNSDPQAALAWANQQTDDHIKGINPGRRCPGDGAE